MLMLKDNSHKQNGIYEDGESFSDTEKYLQINDRPLPPGTARLPNGGIVVSDLDLPEDLPRYPMISRSPGTVVVLSIVMPLSPFGMPTLVLARSMYQ